MGDLTRPPSLRFGHNWLIRRLRPIGVPRLAGTALFVLAVVLFLGQWETVRYSGFGGGIEFGTTAELSGIDLVMGRDFEWDGELVAKSRLADLPACPEVVTVGETLAACDRYKEVLRPNTYAAVALALARASAGIGLFLVSGLKGRIMRLPVGASATVAMLLTSSQAYEFGSVQDFASWDYGYLLALLAILMATGAQIYERRGTKIDGRVEMLSPWLAVSLNIVPLGAGYLYAGRFRRFGVTLILSIVSGIVGLLILIAMFFPFAYGEKRRAAMLHWH